MLQLRHIFLGRRFLGERPGQHEFGFENRPRRLDSAVECGANPSDYRVPDLLLDVYDDLTSIRLDQRLFSASVATPSCTMRFPDKSSRSLAPRFCRHNRSRAAS
jgi:hypothetical protein